MSVKLINHRNSHQRAVLRMETSSTAFDEDLPMLAVESVLDLLEEYWMWYSLFRIGSIVPLMISCMQYVNQNDQFIVQTSFIIFDYCIEMALDMFKDYPLDYRIKFNGELFTSMVLNRVMFSDGQKLQFLKPGFNGAAEKVPVTKRSIMSAIASLYDPLGLLAPTVVKAKILLQNIWRMGVNWNESISDQLKDEWIQFYQNLPNLNDIVVFRWLGSLSTKCLELHGFSDASDNAYSAVVYSRIKQDDGSYKTNIVIAKTRVAPIKRKDKLLSLNPFIGADGILRVGGRLSNSLLTYDEKFPIILPKKDPITNLIIREIHLINFHAGPTLMLSQLRRRYWIIAARVLVKKFTRHCIKCCRIRGRTSGQIMGNLPSFRVTCERAFLRSAVDYTGAIQIKIPTNYVRKYEITKGYVAVFICLATKSIHLEVVSDQTTEKFLEAFKRFSSRKGVPRELRSDNGSNFVGCKNELARLLDMLQSQVQNDLIRKSLARVVKIKPGKDKRVRVAQLKTVTVSGKVKPGNNFREMVAELKTSFGQDERAVHNLCILPLNDEELNS